MGIGADRLRGSYPKAEISPFGERVADLLDEWQFGLYHMDPKALQKARWYDTHCIQISLGSAGPGGLATYDYDNMTRLVFLAHEYCIRIAIHPGGTKSLTLVFHPRSRDGDQFGKHPTIDEALVRCHEAHVKYLSENAKVPA